MKNLRFANFKFVEVFFVHLIDVMNEAKLHYREE